MENENHEQRITPTVRELYPTLSEAELKEAELNLRRYFKIAADVHEEQTVSGVGFDTTPDPTTMEERSNANLKS